MLMEERARDLRHRIAEIVGGVTGPQDYELDGAILAAFEDVAQAERERAARSASHVFLNDPYALHPDIAFDDLNESARIAAHSMAQVISRLILNADDPPD